MRTSILAMETRTFVFAFALLVAYIATAAGKPGNCPDPALRGPGIATSTCDRDEKCAGYLKCCPNSVGAFTCALPENVLFEQYPTEKEGKCPPVTIPGSRITTCASDQDCSGSLKCCSSKYGASTCLFAQ
ncbi:hypothetical protein B566_EDAN017156 [Ephemera danica]|nr:hypothetical protein B566_EDAN017156 [Ephemera danica]